MAAEAASASEPQGQAIQPKESIITPFGFQIHKADTPQGAKVFLKFMEGFPAGPGVMVPLEVHSFVMPEEDAKSLADGIYQATSGLTIARANEMPT